MEKKNLQRKSLSNSILLLCGFLLIFSCEKDKVEPNPPPSGGGGGSLGLCPWEYYWDWTNNTKSSDSTDGGFIYNPFNPSYSYTVIEVQNGVLDHFLIDASNGSRTPLSIDPQFVRPKYINDSLFTYTENGIPYFYNYLNGSTNQFSIQEQGAYLFFLPNPARDKNLIMQWLDSSGSNVSAWKLADNSGSFITTSQEFENLDFTKSYFWLDDDNLVFLNSVGVQKYNTSSMTVETLLTASDSNDGYIFGYPVNTNELILQKRKSVHLYDISGNQLSDVYIAPDCSDWVNEIVHQNGVIYGTRSNAILDTLSDGSLQHVIFHQQAFSSPLQNFQFTNLPF